MRGQGRDGRRGEANPLASLGGPGGTCALFVSSASHSKQRIPCTADAEECMHARETETPVVTGRGAGSKTQTRPRTAQHSARAAVCASAV